MADISRAYRDLLSRVLDGPGTASTRTRHAAFANTGLSGPLASLVRKVAEHADRVTEADIDVVRASGLAEDQIFELVVCAAIGEASRQYDYALAHLNAVTGSASR
jgi:hypothetical protein